jgi:hypothetical protein
MRHVSGQVWAVTGFIVLLVVAAAYAFSTSPDAYGYSTAVAGSSTAEISLDERVAALETQVALLQTQVGTGSGGGMKSRSSDNDSATVAAGTHTIAVTLKLNGYDNIVGTGSSCAGTVGYDDLTVGATITVMDQAGVVIALGRLETSERVGGFCTFTGTVLNDRMSRFTNLK